jgi:4'-phosphopantetheinyl transferase
MAPATPAELVIQCRALQHSSPPLLILVDRCKPPVHVCDEWLHLLSPQELERQSIFRLAADRERFVLGRGVLRLFLGAWFGQAASEVRIETGSYGKPFCLGGPEFNVSHSGDLILLGVHPCRAVGVDVEQVQDQLEWQSIAQRLWSTELIGELNSLPGHDQCSAFAQYWCQHEAINKAWGWGLLAEPPFVPRYQEYAVWRILLPQNDYRAAAALLDAIPSR